MSQESQNQGQGSEMRLGQATIVYEDPDEGQRKVTVDNEELMHMHGHWAFRTGTDERGNDRMREVPDRHVYYVERNVERFEEEMKTVRRRVESWADEVRHMLPMNLGDGGRRSPGGNRGSGARTGGQERSEHIPVEDPSDERDQGS
ncbi:MAG: hypothetical protein ABEJ28_03280 [Salinigranum sp.]